MKQLKISFLALILLISLFIHILFLLLLFFLYQNTSSDISFAPQEDIPAYFYTPQTQKEEENSWAQLNPMASSLGSSMEMPENIGIAQPFMPTNEFSTNQTMNFTDTISQENDEISQDNNLPEDTSALEKNTENAIAANDSNIFIDSMKERIEDPSSVDKTAIFTESKKLSSKEDKKMQARRFMSAVTNGYLQQLEHEGSNLIKTIGGDPQKLPTQEQLKYECYLAKIQWCLQNAHSILQEKCRAQAQPLQTTMQIYFYLEKDGSMHDLKIMQSSGNEFADSYMLSLFEYASRSFPPLPNYFTRCPLSLCYMVMINWNVQSPISVGFSRNY